MDHSLTSLIKYLTIKNSNNFSIISWDKILKNSIDNIRRRLNDTEVNLEVENTSTRPLICIPILLELLLEELFTNSIQFNINSIPSIKIKISDHAHGLLLEVEDNGIGIREEHIEKIFEMFFKTDQSKSNGLGLYIVKKIVEKLNGSIRVESKRNEGSIFKIFIPLTNQ